MRTLFSALSWWQNSVLLFCSNKTLEYSRRILFSAIPFRQTAVLLKLNSVPFRCNSIQIKLSFCCILGKTVLLCSLLYSIGLYSILNNYSVWTPFHCEKKKLCPIPFCSIAFTQFYSCLFWWNTLSCFIWIYWAFIKYYFIRLFFFDIVKL